VTLLAVELVNKKEDGGDYHDAHQCLMLKKALVSLAVI